MLKVILIDDEPIIREGLKTIINWNAHGYAICGEAANGVEGLEKICGLLPDLAIVDIKMPGMDGLKMINELRGRGIPCEYIILSAYSEFKYAQSAIDLGIGSYILKPIEQTELIEKIEKIRDTVLERKQTKQYMDMSLSLSRNKILSNLALGQPFSGGSGSPYDLYGLDFPWKNYQVGLIEMGKKAYEATELRLNLENEIEGFVSSYELGYMFTVDKYVGILFRNTAYPRILTDLHDRINKISNLDVTISLGTLVNSPEAIKQSYYAARRLMEKKFIYGYKKIITGKESSKSGKSMQDGLEWDIDTVIDELFNAIDIESIDRINDILEDIKDYFTLNESEESIIKIDYSNIYTAVAGRISGGNDAVKSIIGDTQEVLSEICRITSLQELHGYMKFVFLSVTEELSKVRPCDPIKKILNYIDRNYCQDLKLESLAGIFHYNSAYLGKLIRAKTGVQFSTYLDNVRIEKAKQLLKEDLKVYEVARKTGYRYIDYFYKKFKKYVGVSPTDYKGAG